MVVSEKKLKALGQTRDDVTICTLHAQLLQRSNTLKHWERSLTTLHLTQFCLSCLEALPESCTKANFWSVQ